MNFDKKQLAGLIIGIVGLIFPLFLNIEGLSDAGHVAMGIFFLAAAFWMFEPFPIYATSMLVILMQVVLLSKQGILFTEASPLYTPDAYTSFFGTLASPTIILFLGGFVLAEAAVKYDLDKNITRILLNPFGSKPKYILLGLMVVTALLSAFMSNTATTAMMMTVILPIIAKTDRDDPLRVSLALCIPFAANIGGITTPIGTPPNAVVIGALSQQGISIPFGKWMILSAPLVVIALIFIWFLLLFLFKPKAESINIEITGKFNTSKNAWILYAVFGLTVLFWISESLHGVKSAVIALVPVVFLSLFNVVTKEDIRRLPWEVLWLVAGGLSMGISMESTGLAEWIVGSIDWTAFGTISILVVFSFVTILLSNFLSHTVTATLLIPLAVSLATSGVMLEGFNLIIVSLVIGVSSSLAMILPISTPPNAIAMSTGTMKTADMAKAGVTIGLFGMILIVLYALFYWPFILN